MIDGLTDEERVEAWLASWHPSFEGKAIVDKDFQFRAVNPQFCEILEVTPAELINSTFTDITPQPVRDLDRKNAEMVMEGTIDSYLLPKTYELPSGRRVDVTLLVNGVYHPESGEFMFFVSTIMARKRITSSVAPSQLPQGLLEWVDTKRVGWGIITILGAVITVYMDKVVEWIKTW